MQDLYGLTFLVRRTWRRRWQWMLRSTARGWLSCRCRTRALLAAKEPYSQQKSPPHSTRAPLSQQTSPANTLLPQADLELSSDTLRAALAEAKGQLASAKDRLQRSNLQLAEKNSILDR